jgi:hypothetical protein
VWHCRLYVRRSDVLRWMCRNWMRWNGVRWSHGTDRDGTCYDNGRYRRGGMLLRRKMHC